MIPAEKMRVCPGQRLGNYEIRQMLGRGGFAEVYLGEHVYLGTRAALKVLTGPLDEHEAEAFQREARLLAGLVHPHIVRVLEFGIQDGLPFLVLDYAPGGSLRKLHPKGERLPLATVIEYVRQTASALHYAHSQHLIHRDVKPENLLLNRDGQVLLADFGIALLMQSLRSVQTQQIVGTPTYMAPEQLQGRACQASDQYALGVLAYEWLCGRPPFVGSPAEIAAQHCLASPPPLRDRIASLPLRVEQVILRALAKHPSARFPSVNAFAEALVAAFAAASTMGSTSLPPRPLEDSVRPVHSMWSRTQLARPWTAAPALVGGTRRDPRQPFVPTAADKRQGDPFFAFLGTLATRLASTHSTLWALLCGGGVGFFSSGFPLLLYVLAAQRFPNPLALLFDGPTVLACLFWLPCAGRLSSKYSGKRISGGIAGSLAGPVQQLGAWLVGHLSYHLTLPISLPLLLLLWGGAGGLLGLLVARRRRRTN